MRAKPLDKRKMNVYDFPRRIRPVTVTKKHNTVYVDEIIYSNKCVKQYVIVTKLKISKECVQVIISKIIEQIIE